ncbi:MAG: hypothetical protein WCJ17_03800 [bacterium]
MKNKLVLLLAATLGLTQGFMKAGESGTSLGAPLADLRLTGDGVPGDEERGSGQTGPAERGGGPAEEGDKPGWLKRAGQALGQKWNSWSAKLSRSGAADGGLEDGLGEGRDEQQRGVGALAYVPPVVEKKESGIVVNGVEISPPALQGFLDHINGFRLSDRSVPFVELTVDRLVEDLAAENPTAFNALQVYAARLPDSIIIPAVVKSSQPQKLAFGTRFVTQPLKRAGTAITGAANGYVDGYRLSNWNATGISKKRKAARLSSRVTRDLIHAANVANLIAELAGDRNMVLDGLNVNKTLAKNKNLMWLRTGKSKSARALRVLISFAQAGLLGTLNQLALGKLVKMADAQPSAEEGEGEEEA